MSSTRRLVRFLLVAACAGALAACSDSTSDSDSGAAPDGGLPDSSSAGGGSGGSGSGGSGGATSTSTMDGGATGTDGGATGTDGGATGTDAGATASDSGLPPPATCGRVGDSCTSVSDCCSGLCDTTSDTCISTLQMCAAAGDACAATTDCCSLRCRPDNTCEADACIPDNAECIGNTDCCSRLCISGVCSPLNLDCRTSGNECTANSECCSGLCKDDKCQIGASFCIQEGDICARPEDCCTGRCELAAGRDVGVCGPPPSGASFCNDGIEGSICAACNDCCSRLCAPFGPSGVDICQPASGCHVTGDFCREDRDCCGADGTGLPGEGNVMCEKELGSDLGICRNPMSCSPQGNVCHFKDYVCGVSSARANCCGGLGAKGGVCELDGLGVPRCNGLTDCIPAGDICASAADCCNDLPCVPDDTGVLHCYDPPGDTNCVPKDGPCTINADCCPGGACIRPIGSTSGSCVPTEPPPPTDGGTPSSCAEYGQICGSAADCCNSVPCTDGICRVPFG